MSGRERVMSGRQRVMSGRERVMSGRRDREAGLATLFGLGLVMIGLIVAGFAVDLWRLVEVRRNLAADAEAVVAAAANGVDVAEYRATGEPVLDPELAAARSADRAAEVESSLALAPPKVELDVTPDRATVTVRATVDLVLLDLGGVLEPIEVVVQASAAPTRGL